MALLSHDPWLQVVFKVLWLSCMPCRSTSRKAKNARSFSLRGRVLPWTKVVFYDHHHRDGCGQFFSFSSIANMNHSVYVNGFVGPLIIDFVFNNHIKPTSMILLLNGHFKHDICFVAWDKTMQEGETTDKTLHHQMLLRNDQKLFTISRFVSLKDNLPARIDWSKKIYTWTYI